MNFVHKRLAWQLGFAAWQLLNSPFSRRRSWFRNGVLRPIKSQVSGSCSSLLVGGSSSSSSSSSDSDSGSNSSCSKSWMRQPHLARDGLSAKTQLAQSSIHSKQIVYIIYIRHIRHIRKQNKPQHLAWRARGKLRQLVL